MPPPCQGQRGGNGAVGPGSLASRFWPPCLPGAGDSWEVEETHTSCCMCLSLALTWFTLVVPGRNLGPHSLEMLPLCFILEGGQAGEKGEGPPSDLGP